jgi:hypothetical protein
MERGLHYLNELTWGYRASRVLQVAVQLKVFSRLDQNAQTSEDLGAACSAKPQLLEKVLIACCAMGLLEKKGPAYQNTELSEKYLVETSPLYQGNIIAHAANVWDYWQQLPDEILQVSAVADPSEEHRNFILGMHNITMGGRGQLFLDHIDLSGRKKLYDVGGGPGTYAILACRKYPQLKATVFDLPETIAITRQVIEKEGAGDRVLVREGSWETDDFGDGNDVVLLSNILHGPESTAALKLQKVFNSLVPGGLVAVQEFVLNDAKTGPLVPALFNVMVGAYALTELMTTVADAGFANVKKIVESAEIGCAWITAVKP